MQILMTGAGGMLGSALYPHFKKSYSVHATDLKPSDKWQSPLDVRDYNALKRAFAKIKPRMVFHLAAETDVDLCERDPDHAFATNAMGTQNVALLCAKAKVPMLYISTAGVFDGKKSSPYHEFDEPNPVIVYGASKLAGEHLTREIVPQHFIVRAGWMVGGGKKDHKFIAKIIEQLRTGKRQLHCVTDKLGTPTYTEDFARTLGGLIKTPFYGLYHMVCEGGGSRYDVALEMLRVLGRNDVEVVPVDSDFWKEQYPAPRPRSEMMENMMLRLRGLNQMRPWKEALRDYLDRNFAADKRG